MTTFGPFVTGDLGIWNLNKQQDITTPLPFCSSSLIFSHSKFGMFTSLITKFSLNYVVVPSEVSSFCITYLFSFFPLDLKGGVGWEVWEGEG
jgi:hypothetical protein